MGQIRHGDFRFLNGRAITIVGVPLFPEREPIQYVEGHVDIGEFKISDLVPEEMPE